MGKEKIIVGLIRKSLYLASGGIVAPNSKKQRRQAQILAALQGRSPKEVKRAGGRYDFEGFLGQQPTAPPTAGQRIERPTKKRGSDDADLQARINSMFATPEARWRAEHVPASKEYRAVHR